VCARVCLCEFVRMCEFVGFQFSTPRSHNHQGSGNVRGHVTPLFGCGILLPFPRGFPQLLLRTSHPGVARLLAASTLPGEGPPVEGGESQVGRGATPLRGILVSQSTRSVSTQPTVIFPKLRTSFLSDPKNLATNATDDLLSLLGLSWQLEHFVWERGLVVIVNNLAPQKGDWKTSDTTSTFHNLFLSRSLKFPIVCSLSWRSHPDRTFILFQSFIHQQTHSSLQFDFHVRQFAFSFCLAGMLFVVNEPNRIT